MEEEMDNSFDVEGFLESAELRMEITPYIENVFKGDPLFLELEMLQGDREELPNGMVRYRITITDPVKQAMLRDFCLLVISQTQNPICPN